MLYDERVGKEIEARAKAILGNASHILYGDASEEDIEEARQAVERAKHEVAQRQEKDLLDMLYEWRQGRESRKINLAAFAEAFDND